MKSILLCSKFIVFVGVLSISSFFVSNVHASGTLGVTDITAVKTFAEAGGGFDNGWSWVFSVTVPKDEPVDEPILKMKFADWVEGSDVIPATDNIRFYSLQSSNASTTDSAIYIKAPNTYSESMNLNTGVDLNTDKAGRQIEIVVEAQVPEDSTGGSYSTSYGIQSLPDTIKPIITILGDNPITVEAGSTYTDDGATAWDNIDLDITNKMTVEGDSINTHVLGNHEVNYSVTDSAGNSTSTIRIVEVKDTVSPIFTTLPLPPITEEATGKGTVVALPTPEVYDAGDTNPVVINDAPTTFPLGPTTVTWTVTDNAGNSTSTTQSVTIVDITKPEIILNGDNPISIPVYNEYEEPGYTVSDNWDTDLIISTSTDLDINKVGSYKIYYNTTDANGNVAEERIRTVNVTPLPITITADPQTKVFGEVDPELTYKPDVLPHQDDKFSGSIERENGEDVGVYIINQGTLTAGLNYNITFATSTFTITASSSEVTLSNLNYTYDGTPKSATVTTNPSGLDLHITYNGSETPPTNAGSYDVVATITDPNYTGSAQSTLVIEKAKAVVTATGVDKVYDGTVDANTTLSVTGVVSGDDLTPVDSATFADKNVGENKEVTVTGITLDGPMANNYSYNTTATTTANITARPLNITAVGVKKEYDGNTIAEVEFGSNKISTDTITITGTSTFADKSVGDGKVVNIIDITVGGVDAENYTHNTTATANADITKKLLTVNIIADNKSYDGNLNASTSCSISSGVVGSEEVNCVSSNGKFSDKNVGNGKAVTADVSLEGVDKENYRVESPATNTANITLISLTASIVTDNKIYDGNTSAINTTCTLGEGVVGSEDVNCHVDSSNFEDRNAGEGKKVTASISLEGNDSGNYTVNNSAETTANIDKLAITVTAQTDTKVYDGNASSSKTPSIAPGLVVGDDATVSQTFNSKNVLEATTLTPKIEFINGTLDSNYTVTLQTETGSITRADQTITVDPVSIPNGPIEDNSFTLVANASSSLPVSFSGTTDDVCMVGSSGLITILKNGMCSVVLSQLGDDNYNAAINGNQNFTVKFYVTVSINDPHTGPPYVELTRLPDNISGDTSGPVIPGTRENILSNIVNLEYPISKLS